MLNFSVSPISMHWKFQFWPFFHSQKSSFLTFFTNAPIKNCSIFRICLISRSENCNFDQIWTAKIVPVYVLKMPVWIFAPFYFVKERSSQPHSLHSRHLRSQPTQIDVRLVAKAVIAVAAEELCYDELTSNRNQGGSRHVCSYVVARGFLFEARRLLFRPAAAS